MREAQRELQKQMNDLTLRCQPYQVTLSISLTVMSIAMLAGGIMTLRNSEIGLALLRATLLLAIPFDLVRGYFTILITTETSAILTHYTQQVAQITSGGIGPRPAGNGNLILGILNLGLNLGKAATATWILCKIGFYIFAIRASGIHLYKKPRRRLFLLNSLGADSTQLTVASAAAACGCGANAFRVVASSC